MKSIEEQAAAFRTMINMIAYESASLDDLLNFALVEGFITYTATSPDTKTYYVKED